MVGPYQSEGASAWHYDPFLANYTEPEVLPNGYAALTGPLVVPNDDDGWTAILYVASVDPTFTHTAPGDPAGPLAPKTGTWFHPPGIRQYRGDPRSRSPWRTGSDVDIVRLRGMRSRGGIVESGTESIAPDGHAPHHAVVARTGVVYKSVC